MSTCNNIEETVEENAKENGKENAEENAKENTEEKEEDPRIDRIAKSIRVVPDFPKKGIMFQDITTLFLDQKTFKDTVDLFVERYTGKDITVVAGQGLRTSDAGC